MRERSANDEQERGESVAEFSNGGHTREWHSRSRSGGEYSEGRHNTGYVSVCFKISKVQKIKICKNFRNKMIVQ